MYDRLTRQDVEKMEKELEHRKLVVRKEALEDVKEARAQGDLSENFEYKAAKKVKNRNESRIRYLERMLRTAEIVEDAPEDEVGVDKEVTIYIPEDDEEEIYTLVTPIRADSLHNIVSIESPIGRALLHRHVGDTVTIHVSDSYSYRAEIREIKDSSSAGELDISEF